jgi:hypothetical protein
MGSIKTAGRASLIISLPTVITGIVFALKVFNSLKKHG